MDGDLTIERGATIEAAQDVGITVMHSEKTAGSWYRLAFEGSKSSNNFLRYIIVKYGGAYLARFAAEAANLSLIDESSVATDSVWLRDEPVTAYT